MRVRALQTAVVAVLVVTAGCAGLPGSDGDTGDETPSADELEADITDAMSDVETYRLTMEMNISANGQTLSMTQRGVFDRDAERARLNVSMFGQEATMYIDGTAMYVQSAGEWQTQDLSGSGLWGDGESLTRQRQILDSGNVTIAGGGTVDGTETTVLRVDPDSEDLKALVQQQQGQQALDGVTVENATYRMHVANETNLVRQAEVEMTMTVNGQTADTTVTMTFSDYGEPVDVTIPDAATEQTSRIGGAERLPAAA
jgi:outer membrane lipoprotein-sorting protein